MADAATLEAFSDPLSPRDPGGQGAGAAMALAAHAALMAALVWGLNWHAQAPDVVSAELWAAVPQVAAPAPPVEVAPHPEPPVKREAPPVKREVPPTKVEPPAPDPQIAIERERKAKVEKAAKEAKEALAKEALDKKAAEKAATDKAAADKANEARLAKQREDNLRRMMGQIGASGAATGSAARDAAPSSGYAGRLVAHIKPNIVFTETITGNPAAEVEVRTAPSGTIVARRVVKSSGHKEWDEAVLRAIDRIGTLPRDIDGRVPATLLIAFRPND